MTYEDQWTPLAPLAGLTFDELLAAGRVDDAIELDAV
jgi:hypothetical protein